LILLNIIFSDNVELDIVDSIKGAFRDFILCCRKENASCEELLNNKWLNLLPPNFNVHNNTKHETESVMKYSNNISTNSDNKNADCKTNSSNCNNVIMQYIPIPSKKCSKPNKLFKQ